MTLRLRMLALWTPERILVGEVDRVAALTIAALDRLLEERVPGYQRAADAPLEGGLEERRAAMARSQCARVAALLEALGREEAVRAGRKALFPVGEQLGREARERLGAGGGIGDLVRAAKILYRVLGIRFRVTEGRAGETKLCIDRCALAEHYSREACMILSAADEGVVRGLNPAVRMEFMERITEGARECVARLTLGGGEGR